MRPSRLRIHRLSGLLLAALFVLIPGCATLLNVEEPAFTRIKQDGDFELRQYRAQVVAETVVGGNLDEAGNAGFRAIADYIFGNNLSVNERGAEKIAMTAPVSVEAVGDRWRVHFVMPARYTLATLPKPVNPAVQLREIPGERVAVNRFSGFSSEATVLAKIAELQQWLRQQGLAAAAAPRLARYDPPITPPFWRRNEILLTVR
jgi:hypothetical protein